MFGGFGSGIGRGWVADGPTVSRLDSRSTGPKLSPSRDHRAMLPGKTPRSPSTCTSPLHGVEMAPTNLEGNPTKTKGNLL